MCFIDNACYDNGVKVLYIATDYHCLTYCKHYGLLYRSLYIQALEPTVCMHEMVSIMNYVPCTLNTPFDDFCYNPVITVTKHFCMVIEYSYT